MIPLVRYDDYLRACDEIARLRIALALADELHGCSSCSTEKMIEEANDLIKAKFEVESLRAQLATARRDALEEAAIFVLHNCSRDGQLEKYEFAQHAFKPLSDAILALAAQPAKLCEDEGCPHYGTAHICKQPAKEEK